MTVGFFSPLPPARTGVADYSAALLKALREKGAVQLAPVLCDLPLYHLGNNNLHREIYFQSLRQPGLSVIHDAVLHHFFLGSLNEAEYVAEFTFNYGSWMADAARELWRCRSRSAADDKYFRFPMLRRGAEQARGIIVHNRAAHEIVAAHAPDARIFEIPHLFERPPLPFDWEITRLRQQLGCSERTLLCGVFGHLRESKRLMPVIRAVNCARERGTDVLLLVAGSFVSKPYEQAMEQFLGGPGIRRTGFLSERDFWLYASTVDACINLRYPPAGESSGIAIRLMGIGKPVLLTEGLENAGFPPGSFLPVPAGEAEEETVAAYLSWLAADPATRNQIGILAQNHIEEVHALPRVADLYWEAIRTVASGR